MEFVSLARSRRTARIAKLKCNASSNAGASTTPISIRKESSDKFVDDTTARSSYSPGKKSLKRTFSGSDSVTDPQHHFEKDEKKFATPRMSNAGDLTDGDDYDYGDVRNFIPTAPCIDLAPLRASSMEQQFTTPSSNKGDGTDDDEYDPYVYYGDLREFVINNFVPPPIDLSLLKGSDFSSNSEYESGSRKEDSIDDSV